MTPPDKIDLVEQVNHGDSSVSRELSPSTTAATPESAASKHTPGPWQVDGGLCRGFGFLRIERCGERHKDRSIATVSLDRTEYETRGNDNISRKFNRPFAEADARLIAAAPDLLAALQFVLSAHGEQLHDAFDDAHKAIAKATGAQS